jgi:hypothetical protein
VKSSFGADFKLQKNYVSKLQLSFTIPLDADIIPHISGQLLNTGSLKKNARIIKTYHSKIVKHIKMIQVLKCKKRT